MKKFVRNFAVALGIGALAACTTDAPTDVGGSLLSSGDLVTFEVELPASEFMAFDSSFSGYATAFNAGYGVIANNYDGGRDAHTLMQFSLPPSLFAIRTTGTTIVVDSFPHFYSATMVLHLDTLMPTPAITHGSRIALYRTAEPWDPSTTWTDRVDTANVKLPWTTPGGTVGAKVDTVTWAAGDSVMLHVDSATLAEWTDSTNKSRGALLVSETPGSIVHVIGTALHVKTHSTLNADTVIDLDLVPVYRTYLENPSLPSPSTTIRIGGTPAWRTVMRLRDDIAGVTYPCPNGQAGCTVTVDSVHLSLAQLLLKPVRPPTGFAPEDSVLVEVRTLAPSTVVPLSRSPLGSHIGYSAVLSPTLFTSPAASDVVKVDITGLMRNLSNPNVKAADRIPPLIALLQVPEAQTFGLTQFDPNVTLRLVLTANITRQP